jgi:hypothetical protein
MDTDILTGVWSYRAFYNEVDLAVPFDKLRFATGRLELALSADGTTVDGRLTGEGWGTWTDWSLRLSGRLEKPPSTALQWQGRNVIDGEDWVYDYRGHLLPPWSAATDPRHVLAGTVIRSTARAKHDAAAGLCASFLAVKRQPALPKP